MTSVRKLSNKDEIQPLFIRDMPSALQKTAENEINEIPSKNRECIKVIREWILAQPHLRARTDDQWLLNFCRSCKFNIEETKERIDTYYSLRSLFPEVYNNRDPLLPEIQNILKLGLCLPLLKTDGEAGPRVILFRPTKQIDGLTLINVVKAQLMILDILLNEDDNFIIAGQKGLANLKGLNMEFMFEVDTTEIKKVALIMEKIYLTNPKGMYIINNSLYYEKMFRLVLASLPNNLRNKMIIFRDNDSSVYKEVPKSLLPDTFGKGENSYAALTDYWVKKVSSYRDWFLEDQNYGTDESKRCNNVNKITQDLNAIENFKKLEID